jgi:hypothetical protein
MAADRTGRACAASGGRGKIVISGVICASRELVCEGFGTCRGGRDRGVHQHTGSGATASICQGVLDQLLDTVANYVGAIGDLKWLDDLGSQARALTFAVCWTPSAPFKEAGTS